ncbi:hypothetical protein GCM10028806_34140 [Spirosoma terrae]|uniref:Uncharacterized protein n=1 Tax=Spirosoma terrae TaxID=1968276 RepID=A0A6L9L8B7_9BACT|nr:hypothetical protein [Spirosoma terrae]NDU95727.1 hypothetical protein [Spirosoma terrae]
MNETIGEQLYTLRNNLRSVDRDSRISNRYLYRQLLRLASVFIRRDSDSRRILKLTNLYQVIDHLVLDPAEVPAWMPGLPTHVLVGSGRSLRKSRQPLPALFSGQSGDLLLVTSLDGSRRYHPKNPALWPALLNRQEHPPGWGYYHRGADDHLYLIGDDLEAVTVRGLFQYPVDPYDPAISRLEQTSPLPDYLVHDLLSTLTQSLRQSPLGIPPDELQNDNRLEKTAGQAQ